MTPEAETSETSTPQSVSGRTVLIAGATSASGEAVAAALIAAGAHVIAVGRDDAKLAALTTAAPGVVALKADLTDEHDVARLVDEVHDRAGTIDGLVHLVGGWRGGGGLAGQSEADYRFLEGSLTALRFVTRAFNDDLVASPAGRFAMVSSTAVGRPLAGGANYAAVKAASEAWTRAIAHGFKKAARDAGEPLTSAAIIFRVKGLAGLESTLADAVVDLWREPADTINDEIRTLSLPEGDS